MRSRSIVLTLSVALLIIALARCSDRSPTRPADTTDLSDSTDTGPTLLSELVVSDTSALPGLGSFAGARVATAFAVEGEQAVVYISVPAGSVPDGELAIIRNRRTDSTTTAQVTQGGISAHPVAAMVDDVLDIDIRRPGGTLVRFSVTVPRSRPPRIVRAYPPRGKTGVPLNSRVSILFTEPVDQATLAPSVSLHSGADTVAGAWRLLRGGTEAVFEPAARLAANTDYRLDVGDAVRDRDGETLGSAVAIDFSTGTTINASAGSTILDVVTLTSLGGGGRAIDDQLLFMLRASTATTSTDSGTPYPLFENRSIRDGDDGDTLVATTATDPDFAGFAALLVDGIDNMVSVTVGFGGGSGSSTQGESRFFPGRPGPGPDFAGHTIDRVMFVVDTVRITSPGTNPNGDGIWTDVDLSGRVVVIGRRSSAAAAMRVGTAGGGPRSP